MKLITLTDLYTMHPVIVNMLYYARVDTLSDRVGSRLSPPGVGVSLMVTESVAQIQQLLSAGDAA